MSRPRARLGACGRRLGGAGDEPGDGLAPIESVGIEAVEADPDRLGTITDLIADVTVIVWLMGSASDAPEVNRERLESLLDKLVDSPVRGFVYEARGSAPEELLEAGAASVAAWGERFRIPVAVLRDDPGEHAAWLAAARSAVSGVLG